MAKQGFSGYRICIKYLPGVLLPENGITRICLEMDFVKTAWQPLRPIHFT